MISDFVLDEEDIIIRKMISDRGKGTAEIYSKTYYRGNISESGKEVVICEISKEDIKPGRGFKHILREIEILAKLSHPFVIKLVGFILISSSSIKVVCEYIPNGSLNDVIKQAEKNNAPSWYDGTAKTKIAYGIAVAMAYIHSKHIIHRNLNLENVLLDEEHNPIIKDISKFFELDISKTYIYTRASLFIAPEILSCNVTYDYKADVFAYSIILYSLLTSKINPYPGMTLNRIFKAVTSGNRPVFPENIDRYSPMAELIQRC